MYLVGDARDAGSWKVHTQYLFVNVSTCIKYYKPMETMETYVHFHVQNSPIESHVCPLPLFIFNTLI